jgi:gliding motility associated protien GldN
MKYSRLFLVALSSFIFGVTAANAQSNTMDDFFNENGEIASDLPTSYEMEDLKPIEFVNPRADDIYWQKVVYRVIDLRERMNYPLYYPEEANDGRESFFAIIFKLVNDRKVPAFRYNERTEKFNKDNLIDVEEDFLKKYDLIYKTKVNPTTKVKTFEVEDADIPNTEVIKYYVKEVWFFDKNSSTFNVKIISICPVLVTNKGVGIQSYPLFWIPFDKLRPYMALQYAIPNRNEVKRVTFDEFFQKHLYTSYIVGEGNMYNRWIPDYAGTEEQVKKEQERIATEMLNFEQDLWEY